MDAKRFAIIGVAGYIAPRHLRAIKDTGNEVLAALDPFDSVGVIDSYFPDADFFTEFERFDRHLEKLRKGGRKKIDYVSICSPNYLHDAHVRFALRVGSDAICEKPLVLNPWNVKALSELENETGKRINVIMQLRLHPAIVELKRHVEESGDKVYDIDLSYVTGRGKWYGYSWKGDPLKSGGVATNIGVHFFDILNWIFGPVERNVVHIYEPKRAAGLLELKRARVRWFLSLERSDLPVEPAEGEPATYRSLVIDGDEVEFSKGFTDLHTESYRRILAGEGYGPKDVAGSIEIVTQIRIVEPVGLKGDYHPFLKK